MTALTSVEQQGVLFWFTSDGKQDTLRGHFYLMGDKVVARKFRGRNYFHLTDVDSVYDFRLLRNGK